MKTGSILFIIFLAFMMLHIMVVASLSDNHYTSTSKYDAKTIEIDTTIAGVASLKIERMQNVTLLYKNVTQCTIKTRSNLKITNQNNFVSIAPDFENDIAYEIVTITLPNTLNNISLIETSANILFENNFENSSQIDIQAKSNAELRWLTCFEDKEKRQNIKTPIFIKATESNFILSENLTLSHFNIDLKRNSTFSTQCNDCFVEIDSLTINTDSSSFVNATAFVLKNAIINK